MSQLMGVFVKLNKFISSEYSDNQDIFGLSSAKTALNK